MPEAITRTSNRISRFARWLTSPRILGRCAFAVACFITLLGLFYTEENWRGKRAWTLCRRELEAKGVTLDWAAHIPPPVADDQNIYKAPKMAEWFVKSRTAVSSNEFTAKASTVGACLVSSNRVAEVTFLSEGSVADSEPDVVLHAKNGLGFETAPAEAETLKRAVHSLLLPSANVTAGPSLKGAQNYLLVAQPTHSIRPLRVLVLADNVASPKQVGELFPKGLFATEFPGGESLRVEPVGTNSFHVLVSRPDTFTAAEYLACSDRLTPEFGLIRTALERQNARREGDYAHPWAVPIPNFVTIRTVAQTLAQRAQSYLLLGQPAEALRELTLLHQMDRLIEGKPTTLVAAMIQVAITGLYCNIIADGLRLQAWQEPQLLELQRQLADIHLLPLLDETFDMERAGTCSTLETSTPSELEKLFVGLGAEKVSLWSKLMDPAYFLNHLVPRGWIYQNMTAIALRNQWFIEAAPTTNDWIVPSQIEATSHRVFDKLGRFSPYTYLARIAIPNYLKAWQTTAHNQTTANQAKLACALEQYRFAHHEYPENLEALVPSLGKKLPLDILSGEALKYRRLDDGFLLYSVGWNESDDGGVPGKGLSDGDWVWDGPKP
jgi:hypothetical protein